MSEAAQAELRLRLAQQELVASFAGFVLRVESLEAILEEAPRVAAAGLGCERAKVLRHVPELHRFLVCAGVGWEAGVVGHATLGEDLASPAGFAFVTGEPVICNDLAAETRFRTPELLSRHGVRRALNVLVAGPEPTDRFGVLEVDASDRSAFGEADTAFLRTLAGLLSSTIARHDRAQAAALAKDLLMQEAHHRIKNSLQLVQNLLSLQARACDDEQAASDLQQSAARVHTIAAIHDRLYQTKAALTVEVGAYLKDLVQELTIAMASTCDGRTITVVADDAVWPAADVTTLGLVLNELVTNALKYGAGEVRIRFVHPPGSHGVLTVCDEGDSLPADFAPEQGSGLGMRLIKGLLRGEGAGLRIDRQAGSTCFVASLPRR